MIIDAHCHLGRDVVYDFEVTESRLLGTMAENGIGGAIVQPCIARPYLEDTRAAHDRIAALCQAHPGLKCGLIEAIPHIRPGCAWQSAAIRILGRTITAPSCGAV